MGVTGQNVLVTDDRRRHLFTHGIIYLSRRWRGFAQELGVVELMPTILLAVEDEAPIAQRQSAVGSAGRDAIGQHTAHRVCPVIGDDVLAQIHHATTFGDDTSSFLSVCLDGHATGFIARECFQVFFRIATRQIQQVDAVEGGNVALRVEELDVRKAVHGFLIEEREALCIPGYENVGILVLRHSVLRLGTISAKADYQIFPIDMAIQLL
jgi:hypothetical protein